MAQFCSFSGKEIQKGTGKMFVKDNGQILYFANRKSEKNMLKLKRDNRKFKWTKAAQDQRTAIKNQEATQGASKSTSSKAAAKKKK